MDLEICQHIGGMALQARACGNLGSVYESICSYIDAVKFFEKQLQLTAVRLSKAYACGSLGLALRASGDNENSRTQMETAAQLLESVRYDQRNPEGRTNLFDLQTSCYHMLQQKLVAMQRNEDALVTAERCKARSSPDRNSISRKTSMTCSESIYDIVNGTKTCNVLYFSLAGDELYAWFLQPQKGVVRFHAIKINEDILKLTNENLSERNGKELPDNEPAEGLLERYINLGVNSDSFLHEGDGSGWRSSSENLLDDYSKERAGFLRMVNRNYLMNSSNYLLSSLFSLGSVGGAVASLQGSTRLIGSLQG